MKIKRFDDLVIVVTDKCPICGEIVTLTLAAYPKDKLESFKFFCVDHGAWIVEVGCQRVELCETAL